MSRRIAPTLKAREHLVIQGLLDELPPVGAVFSDEDRAAWAEAALATFNVLFTRPDEADAGTEGE